MVQKGALWPNIMIKHWCIVKRINIVNSSFGKVTVLDVSS